MQLQGTVVQINMAANVKKQDGGTYEGWQLVYNTQQGEVKTIAKPVQSLKYNGPLKAALSSLVPGDEFTLEMDKNKAGFWDVKDCIKGAPNVASSTGAPVNAQKVAATPSKSTYETSEERAAKQVYIVRQSSIANAINFLNISGAKKHTTEEALAIAKQFEDFVFGKEVAEAPVTFADFENDMPM